MAISFGAQAVNSTSGTSQTTHTATLALSAGDLVIVSCGTRDNVTLDSVTGTVNATYTLVDPVVLNSNNSNRSGIFYFQNSAAGTETVTLTLSAAGRAGVNISRWSGASTTSALDQDDGASTIVSGTSHNAGSITTTGAGLIFSQATVGGASGGFTFTDFTALTSPDGQRYNPFYRIVTGSTAETGDYTTGSSVLTTNKIASFNEASGSDTPLTVDKADLQPSGSAIAFASLMALTPASFGIDGQVVALQWQQDTLTIAVDAASVTIAPQLVDGRRGVPVGTGSPTISGQDVALQLSSGDWTLAVDSGTPTILGQDLILEDTRYFTVGTPTLSPGTIVLTESAVVTSAAPSIAGQTITLTWGQASVGVETASFSVQGQDIVLSKTWIIPVTAASFDIDGQNVVFDWVVPATVVVEPALFSFSGSSLTLGQSIPVTSTAISLSPQSIGRGDATTVTNAELSFAPSNIDLLFDWVLGIDVVQADFSVLGNDVVLYVGTGAPTRFRSDILKDKIQIAFSKPQTFNSSAMGRIRG